MPAGRRSAAESLRGGGIGWPFGVLLALLALCVIGGGASRPDVLSLLYLRPGAITVFAVLAWRCVDWSTTRPLAWLLAALAALYALQLVPLAPALHGLLPGRAEFDAIQRLNGTAVLWRSMSIDPDATWNALISLTVPGAVLVGLGAVWSADRRRLLVPMIGFLLSSALLGVLQVTGGPDSPFYLYRNTYPGYSVGWFANRNHQATALACLFPLLRVWAMRRGEMLGGIPRHWIAAGIAILVVPLIVITGSRAGIALAALSLALSAIMMPTASAVPRRQAIVGAGVVAAVALALSVGMLLTGRAASFDRLLQGGSLSGEGRIAYLATEWRVLTAFWPWGVGAGAFDPAIRMFEPDAALHSTYFNHAHNDFLEMILVAGLPALLLMSVALVLLVRWTIRALRSRRSQDDQLALARAGAVMLWIVLAASTIDYPLRAPLMAALMTIAAVWLRGALGVSEDRPVAFTDRGL